MAHDDDHYTLSPESIFVKAPSPKTLSTRIDEFYLGLLRLFILLILAMSLVGAILLGYRVFTALSEEARPYTGPLHASPGDRFLAQLKKEAADSAKPTPASAGSPEQKSAEAKGDVLDGPLNRQVAIVNEFLALHAKGMTNPALFKERQRAIAEELAASGAVADPLTHLRYQAEFLERVLKDKATLEHVRLKIEQSPAYLDDFMSKVLDYYPNLVRDQRRARLNFEREENARISDMRANSMPQLYAAVGLFLAFLVISVVLVLLKIERNLRIRGDVIQVVS